MRVRRPVPRGGVTHGVGALLFVSEAAARELERARPPFAVREKAIEEKNAAAYASEEARAAANAAGLDLRAFSGLGRGPNGRAEAEDVRGWLRRR